LKDGAPVTAAQTARSIALAGFLHQEVLLGLHNQERASATFYPTKIQEYSPDQKSQPVGGYPCGHCALLHPDQIPCEDPFSNGPRSPYTLSMNDQWRFEVQAVIISHYNYHFMPPKLRNKVISLIIPGDLYYSTRSYFDSRVNKGDGLYKQLMSTINLIGRHVTLPIFVEFQPCRAEMSNNVQNHFCGFLKVLKTAQESYSGILVATYGVTCPVPSETAENYLKRKFAKTSLCQLFTAYGTALGVPVGVVEIQDTIPLVPGLTFKRPHWKNEPLFNQQGGKTREYFSRLAAWFETRIAALQDTVPTRIIRVGPPSASVT
jgi:hypothetical protein